MVAGNLSFLIVDDHPIMRLGTRQLIERQWPEAAIEEAESIADASTCLQRHPVDLVVLDLALPDADGVEGAARMLRLAHGTPILILSQNTESAYAPRLLQMGVRGYLPKHLAGSELVGALRRVLDGGRYVTPALADLLLGLLDGATPTALPHEQLSAQEFRVMQLIAAGRSPAEIALTMHLSVKTVGSYRARILEKTGWQSNAQLTKYCLQHGLTNAE
jgi:DNA-binding NarL/FixJ family response regulator